MAKRAKSIEVSKFGGSEKVMDTTIDKDPYEIHSMEAESTTKLEDDTGSGAAIVIRQFKFKANPEIFAHSSPTKQELFNSHLKGIELMLWRDGLSIWPDTEPQVKINAEAGTYEIFVGAKPMKGHILHEQTKTLSEIAHG